MRNSRIRRFVVLVAALLCCAAVIGVGTMAYFTAEETVNNVITTGTLSMQLKEETTGGAPFPTEEEGGVIGVMPGMVVDKVAYVVNDGNVDFYARVQLTTTCTVDDVEMSTEGITLTINTADWTEKDGWYYYNEVVKPGDKTTPVMSEVVFDKMLGNEYMNARVLVTVDAQAVQAKNNGSNALEAAGWTED